MLAFFTAAIIPIPALRAFSLQVCSKAISLTYVYDRYYFWVRFHKTSQIENFLKSFLNSNRLEIEDGRKAQGFEENLNLRIFFTKPGSETTTI